MVKLDMLDEKKWVMFLGFVRCFFSKGVSRKWWSSSQNGQVFG